jgi:hypothetical protein
VLFSRRILSPAGYLLVAILFLLPFAGLDFDSPLVRGRAGWSGVDLAVGGQAAISLDIIWYSEDRRLRTEATTMEAFYGEERAKQFLPHRFLHSQALAIAAVILVLAGLLSRVLAGERVQALVAAVAGLGAAACLSIAEVRALDFTGPYTSPEYGFWLASGLLAALGIANAGHAIRLIHEGDHLGQ